MATNYEYYKDLIISLIADKVAVTIDGSLVECENISCDYCKLDLKECTVNNVKKTLCDFLNAEHIDQPKLTKRERAFCEAVQTGWIARDSGGDAYLYLEEPERDDVRQIWFSKMCDMWGLEEIGLKFNFIRWEDENPWSIEDLLELEVMDEVQEDIHDKAVEE